MLTEAQGQVLEFVRAFIDANGYPPTRREIADAFSWRSPNSAECVLLALKSKGRVDLTRGVSRGIRILETG